MARGKMKISDIKANPNNPRIIKDDKFKKLVESVKSFPEMLELRPIVVNKDMIILGGNMRYKACKEAGIKEIPVIVADNLTEEQEREFLIKDNVSGGEWDWDILANEWDKEELEEWGLDVQFETVEPEAEEDDFEVDEGIKTDIVLGDLFEIWPHRLLCWDSTNIDDVNKLMNGEKADMVFTDPPYWYSYESNWRKQSWNNFWVLENDDTILDIFPVVFNYMKENTGAYIWTSHQTYPKWREQFEEIYTNTIIWVKEKMSMWNLSLYWNNYEMCLFCTKWQPKLNWEREMAIWDINTDWANKYVHPTQKPVALSEKAIKWLSNIWQIILDLFWWSGSTMVACHQLNRKCYMSELDPKYVQTIINRMIKLDSSIEIKRNWVPYEISDVTVK